MIGQRENVSPAVGERGDVDFEAGNPPAKVLEQDSFINQRVQRTG